MDSSADARALQRILITGIGCVGKSTLGRQLANILGSRAVCVDRDDTEAEPEVHPGQTLIVESVHGLEEAPDQWDMVLYLLPPRDHTLRWLRRAAAWLRSGRVDRPPRAVRRAWSPVNVPLIVYLVGRNLVLRHRWVSQDLDHLRLCFGDRSLILDDGASIERALDLLQR